MMIQVVMIDMDSIIIIIIIIIIIRPHPSGREATLRVFQKPEFPHNQNRCHFTYFTAQTMHFSEKITSHNRYHIVSPKVSGT